MAAVLGHLAQLVVQGLNSVGGGGTSRASGGDTTRRPCGRGLWERCEPAWAPSPASPPSGGSGPGVGLGEVLQGPRPPPRPARCGRAPGGGGLPRGPFVGGGGPQRWGGLVAPAQAHGPWTGARWPRAASVVGRWARRVPPRAALPGGRRPPLRSGAPRRAPVASVRPHEPPVKDGSLTTSWTQTPRVLNSPSTAAPTAMQPPRAGALVVGAGPWTRIAPGGGPRGREGPLRGPRAVRMTGRPRTASVVFGDRPVPAQVRTDRRRQVVAESRTVMPGRTS